MQKNHGPKHNIEVMFLMVLFLILTFSAVSVLLLSINSYRKVASSSESNASARTAVAYIKEMVRQNDDGSVSMAKLGGLDAIKISQEQDSCIYIYEYEGNLCELNAKDSAGASWKDGTTIMELVSVEFKEIKNSNVIELEIGDVYGNKETIDICLRASGGLRDE